MSDDDFLLAQITIRRTLTNGEDTITWDAHDATGTTPSPIELIGLLRIAEHLLLQPDDCTCDDENQEDHET